LKKKCCERLKWVVIRLKKLVVKRLQKCIVKDWNELLKDWKKNVVKELLYKDVGFSIDLTCIKKLPRSFIFIREIERMYIVVI
jgi:hypothetical protein